MWVCKNCFKSYEGDNDVCPHCGYVQNKDKRQVYQLPAGLLLHGRYILGRVLGSGGFGNTYKAWDNKLERFVAIKEYYPSVSGIVERKGKDVRVYDQKRRGIFEQGKKRFLDEARNTAEFLKEPNIVDVYEFFEENNTAYFVMEYLDGVTLRDYVAKSELGRLDYKTAVRIIAKIATALEAVHKKKMIHRDIAPDNIFICNIGGKEVIKLIDFGAARFSVNEKEVFEIILKPGYAPPEQYHKSDEKGLNEQGTWTDVYALGATMYHIITGVKPEESINRKKEDTVPYPHNIDPSIPVNISNAIMMAMAVDRNVRIKNVTDFKKAVEGEKEFPDIKIWIRRRKLKRICGILASIALVAVAFTAFYFNWSKQMNEATLPTATIEVWCIESDGLENGFASVVEQFKSGYNNDDINIELTTFPKEEYLKELMDAIEEGNAPDLFESTELSEEYLENAVSLSGVTKNYFKKNCLFYDKYTDTYDDYKRIPLAFNYKVLYINNVLYQEYAGKKYENDTAKNMQEILDDAGITKALITKDAKSFFEGESVILDASTEEYMSVVSNMTGKYHLVVLDSQDFEQDMNSGFCYEWSIMASDEDEIKVAKRLLEFMLSDYAQSELLINPNRNMLPVNQKTLSTVVNDIFNELSEIDNKTK